MSWLVFSLTFNKPNPIYQITGNLNPLNSLIYKNKTISLEEKEVLNKVIDYDYFYNNFNCCFIEEFHKGKVRPYVAEQDLIKFKSTYLEIIKINPLIYLQNRWKIFLMATGFRSGTYFFTDIVENFNEVLVVPNSSDYWVKSISFLADYRKSAFTYFGHSFSFGVTRHLFKSASVFLGFFLMALIYSRFDRKCSILCALIFAKIVPTFLTTPEIHFKYYGTLTVPCIIVGMICLTLKHQEKSSPEDEVIHSA